MSKLVDLVRMIHVTMEVPNPTPLFVFGLPGCAKTSVGEAVARITKRQSRTVIGAVHDPTDFSGLPFRSQDGTYTDHLPPEFFHEAMTGEPFLIIFDELTSSPPATIAAMMRLVLERKLGRFTLPDAARLLVIGNPPDVAADGHDIPDPMANRLLWWEFNGPDFEEWLAFESGVDVTDDVVLEPMDMKKYEERHDHWIAVLGAYFRGLAGVQLEDPSKVRGRWPFAYATHRSWSSAARHAAAAEALGFGDLVPRIFNAAVGEPYGEQFLAAARTLDMPAAEDLINDPDSWTPDPERLDRTLAVVLAVSKAGCRNPEKKDAEYRKRWKAAVKVLTRTEEEGKDLVQIGMRILINKNNRPPKWNDDPDVIRLAADLASVVGWEEAVS